MAAVCVLTSRPARAESKEILLPLTFNAIAKGDVAAVIDGEDVFMNPADLQSFGLTGPMWTRLINFAGLVRGSRRTVGGTQFVSLRALAPYLTFRIDPATLSLTITANPNLLAPTNLNVQLGPPADIVYSRDNSTFLNYSITDQIGHRPAFFAENGTSIHGSLLYNSVSQTDQGDFARLLTSYIIDDRSHLRRWTAGDATVSTDLLGAAGLVGGVTVSRNFNLDPYFVRYPPLDLRGIATTPSRVEVYVNGALVSQQEIPPGPFELNNIPVQSGAGNAQVVIRDAFGRTQTINQPYYFSTGVLERGLSEFTYSVGALRENFGSKSFDYGSPAFVGFQRYGLTDDLTLGGRLETSRDLISGGPNVSWRSRLGQIDFYGAASDDHGRSGVAGSFGYSYLARRFSFGGVTRMFSREYANLSMLPQADRPLSDLNVFVTTVMGRASMTLLWTKSNMRDSSNSNSVTLLTNLPLNARANLFVSVGRDTLGSDRPQATVFAGLSYFFGGTTSASLSVDHRGNQTQTVAEIDKTLPVGTGFGYRLQTATSADTHTGTGVLQYQNDFGRYEVDFDPFHTSNRPTITAAGGLVYEGRSLLTSRPIDDGFALVRLPGIEGVRVYASNNLVGRTDSNGDLLVPNLLPYYGNRLSIDDRDVPFDYEVDDTEKTVAPPYRGGALVGFPLKQIRTISGAVVVRAEGKDVIPTFGELTLTSSAGSFQSPLGRGGEFYFENLASGTYDALVEYGTGETCRFRIEIPAHTASVVKLGAKTCMNNGAKQ